MSEVYEGGLKMDSEKKIAMENILLMVGIIILIYIPPSFYGYEKIVEGIKEEYPDQFSVTRTLIIGIMWIAGAFLTYYVMHQIGEIIILKSFFDIHFVTIKIIQALAFSVFIIFIAIKMTGFVYWGTVVLMILSGLLVYFIYANIGDWHKKKNRKEIDVTLLNVDKRLKKELGKHNIKIYILPKYIGVWGIFPVSCNGEKRRITFTKERYEEVKENKVRFESDLWHEIYHILKYGKKADTELQAEAYSMQKIGSKYGFKEVIDFDEIYSEEIKLYLEKLKEVCEGSR